jgi:FdrA protein
MIDGRWRSDLINRTAQNPDVGVVLFDLILGLGADPDPASSISESISNAVLAAEKAGRRLTFIASIIGTDKDPQNFEKQKRILEDAGVLIAETNAKSALLAVRTLKDLSTLKEKHEN